MSAGSQAAPSTSGFHVACVTAAVAQVGTTVAIYGRTIFLVDCDNFTAEWCA
jgi:hypothetical protein